MPPTKSQVELERMLAESPANPTECIFRNLSRASRAASARYDKALKPTGLTAAQFTILMTLARLGDASVGRLAEAMGMAPSTVPRVIDPLRRSGLVRAAPGSDRRRRIITITEVGRRKVVKAIPVWLGTQLEMLKRIGPKRWRAMQSDLDLAARVLDEDPV